MRVENMGEGESGVAPGDKEEDVVGLCERGPWVHDQCDQYHVEGATMGDRGGFGVGATEGTGYAIVGMDVLVIAAVS